jgi:hypothetical protein
MMHHAFILALVCVVGLVVLALAGLHWWAAALFVLAVALSREL